MLTPVRLRRLLSAACLVVAPTLLVVAFALAPFGADDTSSEIVAVVKHNQTAYTVVPVLIAVAVLLLIPAVIATIRLAGTRAPYLAYIGGSLAIAGYVSLLPTMMVEQTAMAVGRAGVPDSTAASVLDRLSDGSLVLGILMGIFVAGHILGTTVLGIALIRARVVALWAGTAVAASQPLHFVAHIIEVKVLDVVAFGLLAVGLFAVAAVVFRIPDWPGIRIRSRRRRIQRAGRRRGRRRSARGLDHGGSASANQPAQGRWKWPWRTPRSI